MSARSLSFLFLDVFTDRPFQGGNPLAVFLNASDLSSESMQCVAREVGFSESVFLVHADPLSGWFRVRIFTPAQEIPFAGHPTLGCAEALRWLGLAREDSLVLQEGVGPIRVHRRDGFWEMGLPLPRPGGIHERTDLLAALLGLRESDLDTRYDCQIWGSGLDFLYVPLASQRALERARIQLPILEEALRQVALPPLYVFWRGPEAVHSRMFAPQLGVAEDPATGSAAGPLAVYLAASGQVEPDPEGWVRVSIVQGEALGRPSRILAMARYGEDGWRECRVAGQAVVVARGELLLDRLEQENGTG